MSLSPAKKYGLGLIVVSSLVIGLVGISAVTTTAVSEDKVYQDDFESFNDSVWNTSELAYHDSDTQQAVLVDDNSDTAAKSEWVYTPGVSEEAGDWYTEFTYRADESQGNAYFARLWFGADYANPTAFTTEPSSSDGYRVEFNMRDGGVSVFERADGEWTLLGDTGFDLQYNETVAARHNVSTNTLKVYVVRDGEHTEVLSVDGVDMEKRSSDHFYIQGKKDEGQSGFMTMDDFVFKKSNPGTVTVSDLDHKSISLIEDTIPVTAEIKNNKLESTTTTVSYRIDIDDDRTPDRIGLNQSITFAPGEERSVSFDVPTDDVDAGNYTHGIYTEDDQLTDQIVLVESSATAIESDPSEIDLEPGMSQTFALTLNETPAGFAGGQLNITTSNSSVATITDVDVPPAYELNETTISPTGDRAQIRVVDLSNSITEDSEDVPIVNITLSADRAGNTSVILTDDTDLDDGSGFTIRTDQDTILDGQVRESTENNGSDGDDGGDDDRSDGDESEDDSGIIDANAPVFGIIVAVIAFVVATFLAIRDRNE